MSPDIINNKYAGFVVPHISSSVVHSKYDLYYDSPPDNIGTSDINTEAATTSKQTERTHHLTESQSVCYGEDAGKFEILPDEQGNRTGKLV